jgi:hypothetical protein
LGGWGVGGREVPQLQAFCGCERAVIVKSKYLHLIV